MHGFGYLGRRGSGVPEIAFSIYFLCRFLSVGAGFMWGLGFGVSVYRVYRVLDYQDSVKVG
jgi:hypothetical protein